MRSGASYGLLLVCIGVFTLIFVPRIRDPQLGDNKDPGPRAFPTALAVCLLAGGLAQAVNALRKAPAERGEDVDIGNEYQGRTPAFRNPAVVLLAALIVYAGVMPWLGFSISTFLFAGGMMLWLGTRWWVALLLTVLMIAAIRLLFVSLFKVQLPAGVFELGMLPLGSAFLNG